MLWLPRRGPTVARSCCCGCQAPHPLHRPCCSCKAPPPMLLLPQGPAASPPQRCLLPPPPPPTRHRCCGCRWGPRRQPPQLQMRGVLLLPLKFCPTADAADVGPCSHQPQRLLLLGPAVAAPPRLHSPCLSASAAYSCLHPCWFELRAAAAAAEPLPPPLSESCRRAVIPPPPPLSFIPGHGG
jgi:hypothetical protein